MRFATTLIFENNEDFSEHCKKDRCRKLMDDVDIILIKAESVVHGEHYQIEKEKGETKKYAVLKKPEIEDKLIL